MNDARAIAPQSPAQIHKRVLERFASLFERQVRMYRFVDSIADLVHVTHREIAQHLRKSIEQIDRIPMQSDDRAALTTLLDAMVPRFDRLDATLSLLLREGTNQRKADDNDLKNVMLETNRANKNLESTLIEKELFERHSRLLETIVLSRENIRNWKGNVFKILSEFSKIVNFSYFFVAFSENGTFSITLFSVNSCRLNTDSEAAQRFCERLLHVAHLPLDTAVAIEQYIPDSEGVSEIKECPEDVEMVTSAIPNLGISEVSGLLGIGFASDTEANAQQLSLIRSIMAVMVMVIGSSRALTRSFSELEYHSSHDALTNLYNRRAFTRILGEELSRSERYRHCLSLLMIDLDDFKDINDTYGHPCGDIVLTTVAEILRGTIRQGDFATRIGGDEFTVLLTETDAVGAQLVAEKLRNKIRSHIFENTEGKKFQITTSIGIVTYPDHAVTAVDLMAGVDVGLYQAKKKGKNGIAHSDSLREVLDFNRNARAFVEQIRTSLKEQRIVAHYQPIFDCRSGRLYAHETLARLIEAQGKTLPAAAFIDTIEKYGLARELDQTIVSQSIAALANHNGRADSFLRLFINLSAQEIQNRDVLSYAEDLCRDCGVDPGAIVFEILERDAIGDIVRMREFLDRLRQKGFLFALDDFGSGYNSFHYLRELKFDYVKIDGTFVRNILHSRVDFALVSNLTRLCQDLGIKTIAEFVESADTLATLQRIGVDFVQGFYMGKPQASMCGRDAPHLEPTPPVS